MTEKKIHLVAFDVPFPADYGGAIDVFYRLKALHSLGYQITLHTFEYGRGKQQELEKYATVYYYSRSRSLAALLSFRPFIVQTRKNKTLLSNLLKDNFPILFEGIHTCYYLGHKDLHSRLTFVRMHNIEHEYYSGLQKNSRFLKKFYFFIESLKLRNYQKILSSASYVLAIKPEDAKALSLFNKNTMVLPASFPEVTGEFVHVRRYALFHGNLSVPENERAAIQIIKMLESVIDRSFPLIVAGKNPSKKLIQYCIKASVQLIANPSEKELSTLIKEAQIHVLYTTLPSGIKLKLLSCLKSSGNILVNKSMVQGTNIEQFCIIADNSKDFKMHFIGLMNSTLSAEDYKKRSEFVEKYYNNSLNCRLIEQLIFNNEKR